MCFAITSFDLWKSKGPHDVFALVVNFLGEDSMPKTHYILLILSIWNIRASIGKKFARLFKTTWLDQKIFVYVKNEGTNLNTMTITFKSIVCYETLGLM
jgi:hypothetical protein